jgi:excinuclease ABC subunit A
MFAMKYNPATHIIIKGARQHNLKNVDLVLPKNKLIVFTGLSGSGKSSLAFDTIYAEGQRRYVESLSSYARQFLGIMQKPDVDSIDGLSPAISIDQKTTSHNPRSTVGTITEIYDYLRLLFARIGHPHCPQCGREIVPQTTDQIAGQVVNRMLEALSSSPQTRWFILSPLVRDKKGEFSGLLANLRKQGFERVRIDGRVYNLSEDILLLKNNRHSISVILERISAERATLKDTEAIAKLTRRVTQAVEQALEVSGGLAVASQVLDPGLTFPEKPQDFSDHTYSQHLACPECNISFSEIEPRLFSFNTPHGACPKCSGLGTLLRIDAQKLVAPDLTLSEGAIIPLANATSNDSWYSRKMKAVMVAENSSYTTPYRALPENIKHLILFGNDRWYQVSGANKEGRTASFSFQWEGVVHEMQRRYQETQSDYIRQEFERYMTKELCPICHGTRLKPETLAVTIDQKNIHDVVSLPITDTRSFFHRLFTATQNEADLLLHPNEKIIARGILREIISRLDFLISVGLDYLTLHREAATLAGGEAQRIRLASQIGTGLTGVLYVLDEPTIGLHPRDNDRLIQTLIRLRDLGNTVIVVEHDEHVIKAADYIVDFGPAAGLNGGKIVAEGPLTALTKNALSLTGKYLNGSLSVSPETLTRAAKKLPPILQAQPKLASQTKTGWLNLKGATEHNLKTVDVSFPIGQFVVVTGVSGSGKSSLIHDTLYPALRFALNQRVDKLGSYQNLIGYEGIGRVDLIDQSPIGRTPRSNPATYTKTFDLIRQVFAQSQEAQMRGFKPGRFSFNVKGGRCEACQGEGQVKIEMQFLSDVYVTCDVCKGTRYNAETLSVQYKGLTIAKVLDLTVDQAVDLFSHHTGLTKKLATLQSVGLGYIKLGQPAPTLSGGEAQRVKLAKELSVMSPNHTVYLLDEPTTGLHFEDVKNLLVVLKQLVKSNNTVIVIEHNLDVIKNADHIIDLGPEGGEKGGYVVVSGSPETVAAATDSHTGRYLSQQ